MISEVSERAVPHSAEPITNSTIDVRYTRFWPKKPPRKPVSGITSTIAIMYAVEIHVISWMLAPSSPRMFGNATLTIDASIVAISEPNAIDTATTHLLTGARGSDAAVITLIAASPADTSR